MKNYKKRLEPNINTEDQCCKDPCIGIRDGNKVCLNCGMVIGIYLVDDERRTFNKEEIEKRKQTEPRWRKFGSRTIFPLEKLDSKGHYFNAEKRALFLRLSKIQRSLISGIERNFWEAKPKLKQLVYKMNIPRYIQETAWRIYSIAAKKKLTMGRSIDGILAASLYAAIRIHEFPRILEEVSDTAIIPRRIVIRSLVILLKEVLPQLNLKYKPVTPEQLVFKFGNELDLPIKTQKTALKILAELFKKGISRSGKDPKGIAASAIYIAARSTRHRKTQSDVSEIAKITEVTLRARVKDINHNLLII